jgi:hypothetical protein
MSIQQDFVAYHQSIRSELTSNKNRIRNLIGSVHWLTDGEHKESILRKVIENFAPEIFRIGRGFVCYPNSRNTDKKSSKQIDILITSKDKPTLYKDIDLHLVTADSVKAIIEVKTELQQGEKFENIVTSLSDNVKQIRKNTQSSCWAGLFVYESGNITDEYLIGILQKVADNDQNAVINCVAIGDQLFVRFWENGHSQSSPETSPMWHSYQLHKLAHSYFISNLIEHLSSGFLPEGEQAWFPIPNSKENHKKYYAKLGDNTVYPF